MNSHQSLVKGLKSGDIKSLARCISLVENSAEGWMDVMKEIGGEKNIPVIGFTGPPGAGKSTLINEWIKQSSLKGKKIGIVCIDPTSPFNFGSLLADRIRMADHFNEENVFIRSLATRGSLGGLSAKTLEVCDLLKAFGFDQIIIETVGVGQSEVEIAGLADTTVLVLVPEAGDEIQAIKSGIMEIGDVFVVNKADRPGADNFAKNLSHALVSKPGSDWHPHVVKTVAAKGEGIEDLILSVNEHQKSSKNDKKKYLLVEKAFHLIREQRMSDVSRDDLRDRIKAANEKGELNLYLFVEQFLKT